MLESYKQIDCSVILVQVVIIPSLSHCETVSGLSVEPGPAVSLHGSYNPLGPYPTLLTVISCLEVQTNMQVWLWLKRLNGST